MGRNDLDRGRRHLDVALVSTFPPSKCGLATFAAATRRSLHLARPMWRLPVIEVLPEATHRARPEVAVQWLHGDERSLKRTLARVNRSDALLIQHEFGIFGGVDGAEIIDLVDNVNVPFVAVLHTVLREPTIGERRVVAALAQRCVCLVVMSDAARRLLLQTTSIPPSKVVVIPHGAHPAIGRVPLSDERDPVLLTWGLVGPGKGLERALDAVAIVVASGLDLTYRIVGETHPKVREREGERYRQSLVERAHELGIADHVRFDATYRPVDALTAIVADADAVLIPYDSRVQVTSGVLVEALATGRPVIATAFPHACEVLSGGAGIVVDHDDVGAMADAVAKVLTDPNLAQRMSRVARREGTPMLWPAVGETMATLIEAVVNAKEVPLGTELVLECAGSAAQQDSS